MPTWKELTEADPSHSHNYARRWKVLAAQGKDIYGEARTADAMLERGSKVLDAGCGTGRIGGYLAKQGHNVVGMDIDPILIDYAREEHPDVQWEVGDLSNDEVPESDFDLAISAGNVMGFLEQEGREGALRNIFNALAPGGRFIVGFGEGRGWTFDEFLALVEKVGFRVEFKYSSWELNVFNQNSTFLVAVLARPGSSLLG
ncbi:class I SAM-dependent DNA methyltransferase [Corynebacterium sp. L4756]|uniref:class I SAM-dependent DNA methyltransferase n=1 Tax=unclassified Corynebacterium TaxID=2624378 RepID=UPI00374DA45C